MNFTPKKFHQIAGALFQVFPELKCITLTNNDILSKNYFKLNFWKEDNIQIKSEFKNDKKIISIESGATNSYGCFTLKDLNFKAKTNGLYCIKRNKEIVSPKISNVHDFLILLTPIMIFFKFKRIDYDGSYFRFENNNYAFHIYINLNIHNFTYSGNVNNMIDYCNIILNEDNNE